MSTGLVFEVDVIWDVLTLIVCLGAVFYLNRLFSTFRGGELGSPYRYYMWAGITLSIGLALRVASDLADVDPSTYGLSVRDAAIIIALILFALGLRKSSRFWRPGNGGHLAGA